MKKLQILLPMAAVLLSLTGCKKDNEKSGPSGETVTFTANIGGGEKTEIYEGTKMKWSEGDAITINGDEFTSDFPVGDYTTANFVGHFTDTPSDYCAYYPASLYQSGKYVLPAIQTYNAGNGTGNVLSGINPMYAYQSDVDNKTLQFHNICALVKLQVTGKGTVKKIVVTSTDPLCGEFSVSGIGGYHAEISEEGGKTLTLDCTGVGTGVALNATTPTTFYIALPQGELGNLTFKCSGDAGVWTSQPIATANLTAGKLYTKSLENVELKPAVFSVSATTTVEFAPGNLWYDGNAFHFETNQWDYCVNDIHEEWGTLVGTWDPSHVSHFLWSDMPGAVSYEYNYSGELFCNENFTVDGDNDWRTLSYDEWNYLLGYNPDAGEQQEDYGRKDAFKLSKWSTVTFSESGPTVNGLIIMPDGWQGTLEETTDFNSWQSLASSGAVFLPAAGCRGGTGVGDFGSSGIYWSSTPYGDYEDSAYSVDFSSGSVYTSYGLRFNCYAVRLVR